MSEPSESQCTEYISAALIDIAWNSRTDGGVRIPCEEVSDLLFRNFNVEFTEDEIEAALNVIGLLGLGEIISIGHSRPYFLISASVFHRHSVNGWDGLVLENHLPYYPIVGAYKKLGHDWLEENLHKAFKDRITERRKRQMEIFDRLTEARKFAQSNEERDIPASDRIVTLDHNSEAVLEILSDARNLAEHLQDANDVGEMTADEVEAALADVSEIIADFEQPSVNVREVFGKAKIALTWIGTKAAEAIVGTMAVALLLLIANFFGIGL